MKTTIRRKHSMDSLFVLILLGLFILFLLILLLFSVKAYQASVNGTKENNGIRTAMSYVTTKVHQHDSPDLVFTRYVEDLPALCLKDTINGKEYVTYIYLDQQDLKELFVSSESTPSRQMGTTLCHLQSFQIDVLENELFHIQFTDPEHHFGELFLKPGFPQQGEQS